MQLTDSEKQELLRLARESIASTLRDAPGPSPQLSTSNLSAHAGAFVTLRLHHSLRGCIGFIEAKLPLYEAVEEVGKKAAFEDPRFRPLSIEELNDVEIEISVLSPISPLTNVDEIEVGQHGLLLDAGFTRGLLLPQVATENHWDKDQFLSHTALKAGLPEDAWKRPGVRLFVFTTETFSESTFRSFSRN